MAARVGEVVELTRDVSIGILSGSARKGTKGVVLKEPGLIRRKYTVRLDPEGKEVELDEGDFKKPGPAWW